MPNATPPSPVLRELCDLYGIVTAYENVWGESQRIGDESLVAVLATFSVDASSPEAAEQALRVLREERWRAVLPPVRAIQADAPAWSLSVRLPRAQRQLPWRITLEDGRVLEGVGDVSDTGAGEEAVVDGIARADKTVAMAVALPPGYHRLTLPGLHGETLLISAPARCYRPPGAEDGRRLWGPAIQLYALRSERNWGMGDFTDLRDFVALMAQRGASLVGLNPLHALFAHRPAHTSPYSPSSRQLLNVLYIDPEAVDGFAGSEASALMSSEAFQARLAHLRQLPLVDHEGVAATKFEVLELLFRDFEQRLFTAASGDTAISEFQDFVRHGGSALHQHALFEAIQEQGLPTSGGRAAQPSPWADPGSAEVQDFAQARADRVLFHQYLQWLAHLQLQRAVQVGQAGGMAVGLYLDLAVSVDGGGSDAWCARDVFATGARVGAPADAYNPNGQDWGLLPLRSDRLRADAYRYLIATVRANMQNAGALRIDHVMGLMRLFWIPEGHTARTGTYVHYAHDEILAIVALESQRNRCMVIGEDLGTVAPAMREAMAERDMLSYRLLYFERDADVFIQPPDYPPSALVAVSTHDLATLPGWWNGEDLRVRLAQNLYPDVAIFERQLLDRSRERAELLLALQRAGLLTHEDMAALAFCATPPLALVEAIYKFLAATPCTLLVVQPEDFLGVIEQANMPGTTVEEPNWRRKLPLDLEALAQSEGLAAMGRTLAAARPET